MTDPYGSENPAPPSRRQSYGERRKQRIDALAAASVDETPGVSLLASAWQRLRRNPIFLIGAGITITFVVLAIISPWLAPWDPAANPLIDKVRPQSNPVPGPEAGHPLGADDRGRDLLSRLLIGSQQTLLVGVMATLFGLAGGVTLGTLAGAFGGWIDSVVMRIVDVMLSIPSLLLAFSIAALFAKPNQWTVIVAIAVIQVPIFARMLRGSMLAQRASDHVLAARALGVKPVAIVFRHMLPNALGPVIVQTTLVLAVAIIDAAALSFSASAIPTTVSRSGARCWASPRSSSTPTLIWRSTPRCASSWSPSASR